MDFNVTEYGAKGDGVTDDRAAIQACVDAAHAAGGGTVVFPAGTFIVSGQSDPTLGCILLYDNIVVAGAGMGQTTIKLQDGWNGPVTGMFRDPYNAGTSNITVHDLTIDGNRANTTGKVDGWFSGTAPGSSVQDHNITLDHIEVKDCGGYGFDPHEQTVGLTITNCISHGNALDGFALDFQIDATIANNVAYGNDRHGFNIVTSSHDMQFTDNSAYDNGAVGVMIQRGSTDVPVPNNIVITGGSFYDNGKDGIQINKANNVTIDGADLHGNGQRGVRIIGSVGTVVENSTVHDNSQSKDLGYPEISIESYNDTAGVSGHWYYSQSVRILNNLIYDAGGIRANYGVRESADGSDYTVLSGNTITGVAHLTPLLTGAHSVAELPDLTYIFGTDAADLIHGVTDGASAITGFLGNDSLFGGDLNDLLVGGLGDDALSGGAGDDSYGFSLGDGSDVITDSAGANVLVLGAGLTTGNVVYAQSGSDLVITDGRVGDSVTVSGFFSDLTHQLASVQFVDGAVHTTATLIQLAHTQSGTPDADTLTGLSDATWPDDVLFGKAGNDTLYGGAGNDILDGGAGADSMIGGSGNDTYSVEDSGDVVTELGDDGIDTIKTILSTYTLGTNIENLILVGSGDFSGTGNSLNNALTGNSGNNILIGGRGDDTLSGGAGDDLLNGGTGADRMIGGAGNDTYQYGIGDTIVEAVDGGIDTVLSTLVAMTLGFTLENVTLIGSALSANGNALDNVMTGNALDNALRGGDGNDTLDGMDGNDLLQGGKGADLLHGGSGSDVFLYVKLSDSTLTATDLLDDFSDTDRLDLHLIDADVHTAGDQAFQLVDAFTLHEAELVLTYDADADRTTLSADANGDGLADLVILLAGHITTTTGWDL